MSHQKAFGWQVGVVAALVLTVRLLPHEAVAQDTHEPNDTIEEATQVQLDQEVVVTLDPLHDRDYLRLVSPGDGIVAVRLLEIPKAHKPHVWWINEKGQIFRSGEHDARVRKDEVVYVGIRSNEAYMLENASPLPIRLRVQFESEPMAGEPNDSIAQAQAVQINQEVSVALIPRHDVDYLRLVSPERGVLTVYVLETGPGYYPHLWWVNEQGKYFGEDQTTVQVDKDQVVYLGVRSGKAYNHERASPLPIQLRVEFKDRSPERDPNISAGQVRPLPIDEAASVVLKNRHDRDYLQLTGPGDGVLTVHVLEKPHAHNPYFWWIDDRGKIFREEALDAPVKSGQTVRLGVRSAKTYSLEQASPYPIRLRVGFAAEPFEGEPNDSLQHAQRLEMGQEVSLVLMPLGDRDYLRLVGPADGTLTAHVLETPNVHTPHLWWVDDQGRTFGQGEHGARIRKGQVLYLGVRSHWIGYKERASPDPIRLRVLFAADQNDVTPPVLPIGKP